MRASAQTEGVTVDSYVEQLLNERDEFVAVVERAAARVPQVSHDETCTKIERGYLQSETGEVVDGESFATGLLAELDDREHKRQVG